jgi:hypothetical protein
MAYATLWKPFIGETTQEPSAFGCALLLGMQTRRAPPPSCTRFRHNAVLYSPHYFTTGGICIPPLTLLVQGGAYSLFLNQVVLVLSKDNNIMEVLAIMP